MSDTIEPQQEQKRWSDERVETLVGNLLRFGVIISATVALLGGIPLLVKTGTDRVGYREFTGQPDMLISLHGILRGVLSLESEAIVQLGIVLLIATPVARVILSLFAFAMQRDRTYIAITTIVLAILTWSLMGGIA
jgi:uncharacterized membrane protein